MTLYVSSHYKNSPNDLQLMADAPAHHLFVLIGMLLDLQLMIDTMTDSHLLLILLPVDVSILSSHRHLET